MSPSSLEEEESERGRFVAVGDEVPSSAALTERRAVGFFLGFLNMVREDGGRERSERGGAWVISAEW